MKKLTFILAMLFAFNTTFLIAENNTDALTSITETEMAMVEQTDETAYASELSTRLSEINEMDKSAMTSSEKNELRKEVREIKKEQKNSGGIYISVGAAILIVLLLILLL
jgi:hypothetical protein